MALTVIDDGQPARYFDLFNKPQSLKRENGLAITDSELKDLRENETSIPTDWNVSFGDVLNWSKERPTEAFFVVEDRKLLKNPDRSGSGYLTIPLHVTKNTRNALLKYQDVIESIGKDNVSTIELHPEDIFIKENWGEVPDEILSANVQFSYDPLDEYLYVDIPHLSKSKEFKLGSTSIKNIQLWIKSSMQDQASFRIKYDFSGHEFHKYHDAYKLQNQDFPLPQTWSVEPGTTQIGHDHCHGEWIFCGDRQHINETKKIVRNFYKDLPVITEDLN